MFDNTHVRARHCSATHAPTPTSVALRRRRVDRLVATPVCYLVETALWSSLLLCCVATPLAWLQRSDAPSPRWCARIHRRVGVARATEVLASERQAVWVRGAAGAAVARRVSGGVGGGDGRGGGHARGCCLVCGGSVGCVNVSTCGSCPAAVGRRTELCQGPSCLRAHTIQGMALRSRAGQLSVPCLRGHVGMRTCTLGW